MEELIINVNWLAVCVGAVAAFLVGWLWYSPKLFANGWAKGVGVDIDDDDGPMFKALLTQAVGTFLVAWVIGIAETTNSLSFAVLIALALATIVKANGLFCKKSHYAIVVESSYILVMVAIMIAAQAIF